MAVVVVFGALCLGVVVVVVVAVDAVAVAVATLFSLLS